MDLAKKYDTTMLGDGGRGRGRMLIALPAVKENQQIIFNTMTREDHMPRNGGKQKPTIKAGNDCVCKIGW